MTDAAGKPQDRRFSIAHLALVVPWVALVLGAWDPINDNSFLWHVRAGTLQADSGAVLVADPFSFTMLGEPWRTQSWLAELFYGWAENLSGLQFVPFLLLMVSALTLVGIGLIAYRRSRSVPATAFVSILATLALISFLVPRPVIFSYLLMTLVIVSWDHLRLRWAVPILFWVWAAVHASFVIGLAYVGLSLIMKREWRWLPTAVVAGLATLATAHGLGVVGFLLDFGESSDALRYLIEWRRPELFDPVFLPLAGAIIFIVIGAFRQRIFPRHLWLIVPFVILGLSSVRAIPMAFLGLVPLTAQALSGLEIGSRPSHRAPIAAIFVGFVLVLPFLLVSSTGLAEGRFPVEAASSLAGVPTFHDDVVGGYLIWAEGPERLVYIDDRAELYGDRMAEFVGVREGEIDWQPVFARDQIEQALLRNSEPMVEWLTEAGWNLEYRDEEFAVLAK